MGHSNAAGSGFVGFDDLTVEDRDADGSGFVGLDDLTIDDREEAEAGTHARSHSPIRIRRI